MQLTVQLGQPAGLDLIMVIIMTVMIDDDG
jgi:hypothetical protein